jgi:hypothetical protein
MPIRLHFDAITDLFALHGDHQGWLDSLPDNMTESEGGSAARDLRSRSIDLDSAGLPRNSMRLTTGAGKIPKGTEPRME